MKKLLTLVLAGALTLPAAGIDFEAPMPQREHRAIWMSPFLSATWPMGAITQQNAAARKRLIRNNFAELKRQGINVVYYHVRANCDAAYASSYEPYASSVAGSRGGTPAIDPFAEVVAAGHEYGIEVYAWVNPYRYSSGGTYGAGERNYENSHPEWLIRQTKQIVLNPGIPEVQDRIEAIITEIATNYDIDGMIFDDYFYTSSTPLTADAETFAAYRAAGGTIKDQAAWRRENVNETVRRARDAVKKARPYAVFSIGPAGRISPPNVTDYGLDPAPYGDMNYDELHADCLHWLDEGWLDFLSPQVYWVNYFKGLVEWYSKALDRFDRHNYTSVDCSRLSDNSADIYLGEIDYMRQNMRPEENGVVFFDYGAYMGYYETYGGERLKWGDILARTAFPTPTLQPLQPWRAKYAPAYVTNLAMSGEELTWTEPEGVENHRYAVYRVPVQEVETFTGQREYLLGVSYAPSYKPEGELTDDSVYAVSVYNRYGYEYAPVFMQAMKAPSKPVLTAPKGEAIDLFDFKWEAPAGRYIVEVARDAAFTDVVAMKETTARSIASTDVASLDADGSYYWRVRVLTGGGEAVSDAAEIQPSRIAFTQPAAGESGVDCRSPKFVWTAAEQGTDYVLEISKGRDFLTIIHRAETQSAEYTMPPMTLSSGITYYARVKGTRNGASSLSPTLVFSTADRSDYEAPAFVTPSADGATLHSNEGITVAPWEGLSTVTVQVSNSTSFPSRSGTTSIPLNDFATSTRPMGEVKLSGKALVDGQTYYTRVRGSYMLIGAAGAKYTEYGPVRSFVYSATAGVEAPGAEADAVRVEGDVLYQGAGCTASVYDVAGRLVLSSSAQEVSLAKLPAGCYIIGVRGANNATLKIVR